jgi:hypothetical protein
VSPSTTNYHTYEKSTPLQNVIHLDIESVFSRDIRVSMFSESSEPNLRLVSRVFA